MANDHEVRRLKTYSTWTLYAHENQSYLGRCVAAALRPHAEQALDMKREERDELFDTVVPEWHAAVTALFPVARANLACLANNWRHLHWHLVPRYTKAVTYRGVEFVDPKPSSNYSPTPDAPSGCDDDLVTALTAELRRRLG